MLRRHNPRLKRRECLALGLGALGGGGLASLLRLSAQAADAALPTRRQTSCIFVWLDGGPSQFETFDPKPEAPREIRGQFDVIQTRTPGVSFCQQVPRLAATSDRLSIVRSVCHTDTNHGAGIHYMLTGRPVPMPVACDAYVSYHPSFGAVAALERPAPHGLPGYFALAEMPRSGGPNFLGSQYAPMVVPDDPSQADFRLRDVALPEGLGSERFARRQRLRGQLDRLPRIDEPAAADPVTAADAFDQLALELVTSPSAQAAFDLNREPAPLRDAYGRTAFGQRALLARRLVEAGVPFITLFDAGWDSHANIFPELQAKLPPVDQALAALIDDLDGRGLLETTLVVVLGEFGRAPKLSQPPNATSPGRDHWASTMSILVAGCGTPRGQIIGATDRLGHAVIENRYSPENFAATIYHKLGIDPGKIYFAPDGRPIQLVSDPTPIPELG